MWPSTGKGTLTTFRETGFANDYHTSYERVSKSCQTTCQLVRTSGSDFQTTEQVVRTSGSNFQTTYKRPAHGFPCENGKSLMFLFLWKVTYFQLRKLKCNKLTFWLLIFVFISGWKSFKFYCAYVFWFWVESEFQTAVLLQEKQGNWARGLQ